MRIFFVDVTSDIANYADDTTPYECAPYYDKLKENLELTIYRIFYWLRYIDFKGNVIKCHFYQSVCYQKHRWFNYLK